jgi:hypothetical protein
MSHVRRRTNRPFFALLAALLAAGLAACAQQKAEVASGGEGADGRPALTRFPDVPVPVKHSVDFDKTVIFGDGEAAFGRLVISTSHNAADMFDFYKREMAGHGWQEITSVRAATSVLTFGRGGRVATVQISRSTIYGADVSITVSPGRDGAITPSGSYGNLGGGGMGGSTGGITSAPILPPPVERAR